MLQKNTSNISEKYYKSIDLMPLFCWIECNNGKSEYCRIDIRKGSLKLDEINWIRLQDEYLKDFGLQDTFKQLCETQKEKAIVELDYIITGKRILINKINMLDAKLKRMIQSKGENIEIDEVLIYMSKYFGYKIDKFSITVKEYFNMINIYTKAHGTTD